MRRRCYLLCFPLLLPILAGCVRLEREYPEKDFYSLEAPRSGEGAPAPLFGALRLERIGVSSPFQGKSFIYRTGDLRYQEDFYNRFFAPPAQLITMATARWLRASALFSQVYAEPAAIIPEYFLEGEVSGLYGDFHRNPAAAVLEIVFTLTQEEGARPQVVLRREYRREVPLENDTPASLAAGWSKALAQILAELERDIMETQRREE